MTARHKKKNIFGSRKCTKSANFRRFSPPQNTESRNLLKVG
uniref:Uncharacterized protein n=1 Tax=Arundo donax TaxID=35708 RepID=A0A0A9EHI4_ARUDO